MNKYSIWGGQPAGIAAKSCNFSPKSKAPQPSTRAANSQNQIANFIARFPGGAGDACAVDDQRYLRRDTVGIRWHFVCISREEGGKVSEAISRVFDSRGRSLTEFAIAIGPLKGYDEPEIRLAALDEWAEVRREWMAVAEAYRNALPESNRLRFQDGFGQSWITSTCVVSLADSEAAQTESALAQAGIETRRWWGKGAHVHPATATFPRTPLPATETLAYSTIAIPFFRDLASSEFRRVVEAVHAASQADE